MPVTEKATIFQGQVVAASLLRYGARRFVTSLLSCPPVAAHRLAASESEKPKCVAIQVAGEPPVLTDRRRLLPVSFLQEFFLTMTKIYVGNLPFSADENQVRELFAQHGTVESVSIITDRDTGRPRGFGFVEMNRADASRAIQMLNGKDMGGRPLRVNEAQDKGGGGPRGPRRW